MLTLALDMNARNQMLKYMMKDQDERAGKNEEDAQGEDHQGERTAPLDCRQDRKLVKHEKPSHSGRG